MHARISDHLNLIQSLSVETTLGVIHDLFTIYLSHCEQYVSVDDINQWVEESNEAKLRQSWALQKELKRPHLFLLSIFDAVKWATIRKDMYRREILFDRNLPYTPPISYMEFPATQMIGKYLLSLPFGQAISHLGELAGAWVLTCPEDYIKSAPLYIQREFKGPIPNEWIQAVYGIDSSTRIVPKDVHTIFALDYGLHAVFDDYYSSNTW